MSSHLPHNTPISLNTIPAIHPTVQVVVGQDAIDHTQPGSQAHCGENNCSSAQYRPACCLDSLANTPFIRTNRAKYAGFTYSQVFSQLASRTQRKALCGPAVGAPNACCRQWTGCERDGYADLLTTSVAAQHPELSPLVSSCTDCVRQRRR